MRVWMFEWGGEGMPTRTALFQEDRPPSVQVLHDLILAWLTKEDEEWAKRMPNAPIESGNYNKTKATEISAAFKDAHSWSSPSGYESASLTLQEVR